MSLASHITTPVLLSLSHLTSLAFGTPYSRIASGYGVRIRTTEGVSDSQVKCLQGTKGSVLMTI